MNLLIDKLGRKGFLSLFAKALITVCFMLLILMYFWILGKDIPFEFWVTYVSAIVGEHIATSAANVGEHMAKDKS